MTKKIEQQQLIVSRSYRLPKDVVDNLDALCERFALKKERLVASAIAEKVSKTQKSFEEK